MQKVWFSNGLLNNSINFAWLVILNINQTQYFQHIFKKLKSKMMKKNLRHFAFLRGIYLTYSDLFSKQPEDVWDGVRVVRKKVKVDGKYLNLPLQSIVNRIEFKNLVENATWNNKEMKSTFSSVLYSEIINIKPNLKINWPN